MTRESSKRTLEELLDKLDRLSAGSDPSDIVDDVFVDALMDCFGPDDALSDEAAHYAFTRLSKTLKDEKTLRSMGPDQESTSDTTLGELLNRVRTKAHWDLASVAEKLRIDVSTVERLERDLVPLVQLDIGRLADILEAFHLPLKDFTRLAGRTSLAQKLQGKLGAAYARSRTEARSAQHGRELSIVLARVVPALTKQTGQPAIVDQPLLDGLTEELKRRQRDDLLRS